MVTIDPNRCNNCGACMDVCPALVIEEKNGKAFPVNTEVCISCWHCVAVCPKEAVQSGKFDKDMFRPQIDFVPQASKDEVRNLLIRRRSVREFKNKEVPREILNDMVSVASHSATGHNAQAVKLTVVTDRTLIENLDKRIFKLMSGALNTAANPLTVPLLKTVGAKSAAKTLLGQKVALKRFANAPGDKGMHVFRGAPALVVTHHGTDAISGKTDCVIASRDMMLFAEAAGLGCTWIGFLVMAAKVDPFLKKKLSVPALNRIGAAFIVGWPRRQYKRIIPRKPLKIKWLD